MAAAEADFTAVTEEAETAHRAYIEVTDPVITDTHICLAAAHVMFTVTTGFKAQPVFALHRILGNHCYLFSDAVVNSRI